MGMKCVWCVVILFLVIMVKFGVVVTGLDSKEFQKSLPAKIVWAVEGRDAELPCDATPALPDDNVTMIFWFKDTIGMPLYSLDARDVPLSKGSHLAMSDDLGRRSYFVAKDEPSKAKLRIQRVKKEQPSEPRIFDTEGREIKANATAGPFLEGHELFLSCQVNGGYPKPTLTWWFNDTILDSVVDSNRGSQTTVNQLLITSLPRQFKGGKLECRASASQTAGEIIRRVPLNIFLKPNKVKIVTPNTLLSSGKPQSIRCETSGSYPPAKLTWLLNDKPFRNAVVTEEETSAFTGSILTLTLSPEDNGKTLDCRADNPRFPGGTALDRRRLSVAYPPKASVTVDRGLKLPISEGSDVTLICNTSASPAAQIYYWYHNNHLVAYNESGGILPNQESLVIKNIKQKSAGQYACSARNSEGETYSAPFDLIIQYSPHCKKGYENVRIGHIPSETIMAQCIVDSVPPVNRFFWTYNTSKGVFPVTTSKMQNKGNVSILQFFLENEDIKSLQCFAENDVGKQEEPCYFHIVPAEPPEPPRGCLIRNSSQSIIEVSCIAGNDGGLHQNFILEVNDISSPLPSGIQSTLNDQGAVEPPTFRVLGERPVFKLLNLKPNREYQVVVYAENARGRSDPPIVLPIIQVKSGSYLNDNILDDGTQTYKFQDIPNTNKSTTENPQMTLIIAGALALAVLLIFSIVIAATIIACKKKSRAPLVRRRERSSKPPSELELSEAGFGDGFHRRSALYRASMYGECEERISRLIEGPDLILSPTIFSPHNSDY
ncbi:nephrin isoform X2 [Anthonomus grandis grandis]|uniref:nephrin isoform X2 n=1 Tax=Anthonomus grandis grandis TaxID=2921223 RepID=UPI002165425B|nr:nephrin isoform X2 [Anthonomus grandis grandis]